MKLSVWGDLQPPLAGIILVMKMTDNYQLILPMIIIYLGATQAVQALGAKSLYSSILENMLLRAAEQK